ncbi:Crp/Fnr family transcriptional regulator [Citrobacter amalonaticus]|uniref:Crp/Fnr family transcriptional regulator n=1 Tax=Citrobacter amalonaticus TaxID=35703 RepID=UPI00255A7888|nr:cyclic nucleotide-binding domain-containing protein [Citrobacter amalonaticus]MDL4617341.1 cyclic nucleotide-binding domain-containing protein [Citrobacter amalonaticus]MDL4621439.1 cyclic nucleotide-binding domain-containing protein [Citrobacter amalonaticus]
MKNISDSALKEHFILAYRLPAVLNSSLLASLRLVKIDAGEYLTTQSTHLTHLYFLVDGKLQVERHNPNGTHAVYSFETPFSMIGELELFSTKQCKAVSAVQALSDSLLLSLPVESIKESAMSDPVFLLFMCQNLSHKLLNTSLLHSGGAVSVESKLRKFLLLKTQGEGATIQLEKRESLAAMLGVSVRQLNRALIKLTQQGIIQHKNKSLKVIDPVRLSDCPADKIWPGVN